MKIQIDLSHFGKIIATDDRSIEIYDKIKLELSKDNIIVINAEDVTISTKSARMIFGKLYKELENEFKSKITFINNTALFNFSVNEGISTELEN